MFDKAFKDVLKFEGEYSNDPYDAGGKTKYGITEKVARDHGYEGDMIDLPLYFAKAVYKEDYWNINMLNEIYEYDKHIAYEMFESGVNCGTSRAASWFQRSLNILNRGETLYKNLKVDGLIGKMTLGVLEKLGHSLDRISILKMLNIQQGNHYISICGKKETQEKFIRGWLKRIVLS